MKDFGSRADVECALTELGRQMALRDADHVTIVCCGASALCALGLLSRRTLDIDAIGTLGETGEIEAINGFSPEIDSAIAAAGLSLGLLPGWFNGAASAVLVRGLPHGSIGRSADQAKDFGPCLTVRFMDRIDLIALKMYAALDPKEGRRHVKDLVEIEPSRDELLHGLEWIGSLPSSPAFKASLRSLLEGFDAADLYNV